MDCYFGKHLTSYFNPWEQVQKTRLNIFVFFSSFLCFKVPTKVARPSKCYCFPLPMCSSVWIKMHSIVWSLGSCRPRGLSDVYSSSRTPAALRWHLRTLEIESCTDLPYFNVKRNLNPRSFNWNVAVAWWYCGKCWYVNWYISIAFYSLLWLQFTFISFFFCVFMIFFMCTF